MIFQTDTKAQTSSKEFSENNPLPSKTKNEAVKVVVDGPLSEVYRKALMDIYGNKQDKNMALESQAQDSLIQVGEYFFNYAKERPPKEPVHYLYATNSKTINSEGAVPVYDSLQKAIGSECVGEITLCVETNGAPATLTEAFEDFLYNNNIKLYHTRRYAVECLEEACV